MPLRFVIVASPDAGARASTGAVPEAPVEERTCQLDDEVREVRIGRQTGLEIELPFPAVSFVHARLFRGDLPNDWWLEDLGSLNGTAVDGVHLYPRVPQALRPGQRLRLASVEIIFEGVVTASEEPPNTASLARRLIGDIFAARPDDAPTLSVIEGPGRGSRLVMTERGRRYLIGRGENCDLRLATEHVSREHAELVRDTEGVTVRDLGSKNGVRVRGRLLGKTTRRLADGDRLHIGPIVAQLSSPEERYLRDVQSVADAAPSAAAAAVRATPSPSGRHEAAPRSASGGAPAAAPAPVPARRRESMSNLQPLGRGSRRSAGQSLTVALALAAVLAAIAGLVALLTLG